MNSYREQCIERKLVRSGHLEQRPTKATKKVYEGPWLVVTSFQGRLSIWNSYATEELAFKQMRKLSTRIYVVSREVYERCYKNQNCKQ